MAPSVSTVARPLAGGRPPRVRGARAALLAAPAMALLIVFFVGPLTLLFITSLQDVPPGSPIWSNYLEAVSSDVVRNIFLRTFETAAIVSLVCLVLGYPYAYWMSVVSPRTRAILLIVVLIPFWTSLMVRTFAWQILLRDQGVINDILEVVGIGRLDLYKNIVGVTIGMSHILLPFAVMPMFGTMHGIDRRLLLAAESLGARPATAFLRVYVPLSLPGVVAGITMVFVLSLGFFITPQLLGSPKDSLISQYMYQRVGQLGQPGYAGAIGFILLWITLGILALANRVVRPDQAYVAGTAPQ